MVQEDAEPSEVPRTSPECDTPGVSFEKVDGDHQLGNRGRIMMNRRKLACVECRQQKSKCDAVERQPGPCTKCVKKGCACVLKKDYRRTYKRARHEAIEQRFKELAESVGNLSAEELRRKLEEEQLELLDSKNFTKDKILKMKTESDSITKSRSSSFLNSDFSATLNIDPTLQQNVSGFNEMNSTTLSPEQLLCSPKSIGDISVSSDDIAKLFQEFATRYHPFLPVVDLSKGAERIYNLSPCLFWVILLIGLRRNSNASALMSQLTVSVKSILSEITISPIIRYSPNENDEPVLNVASVYSVQAFLLYSFWPPLTSSLSADISWNTIGTAMFQAVRVGLHGSEFSKEHYSTNPDLQLEKIKTWISCNVVSQIIASSFGFPSYVSFDQSVTAILENKQLSEDTNYNSIPKSIKQMTHIAQFENQIINTMSSNANMSTVTVEIERRQSLLNVLSQELNYLETRLNEDNLDDIRRFLLLMSKIHLLTYYFANSSVQSSNFESFKFALADDQISFETKRGLVEVYNAAIALLCHADSMWRRDPTIIKYFPGVFVLNIWQSACIIGKLAHSSLSSVINVALGKETYQKAVALTLNASVQKHDMAYRSSGIMRTLWSLYANMYEEWRKDQGCKNTVDYNLGLIINSRMSVSVFFDCLYILKGKCGMAKLEREKNKKVYDDNDEEEYDANDHIDRNNGLKNSGKPIINNNITLGLKDPESKARRIIETIPLDPHPINASKTNSTSSTPNSQLVDSSTARLNRKNSLTTTDEYGDTIVKIAKYNTNVSQPESDADSAGNKSTNSAPSAINLPLSYDLLNQHQISLINKSKVSLLSDQTQESQNGNSLKKKPSTDLIHQALEQNSNTFTKESPVSNPGIWDNWQSDIVWNDVDLLMNEFAFDPSL